MLKMNFLFLSKTDKVLRVPFEKEAPDMQKFSNLINQQLLAIEESPFCQCHKFQTVDFK